MLPNEAAKLLVGAALLPTVAAMLPDVAAMLPDGALFPLITTCRKPQLDHSRGQHLGMVLQRPSRIVFSSFKAYVNREDIG